MFTSLAWFSSSRVSMSLRACRVPEPVLDPETGEAIEPEAPNDVRKGRAKHGAKLRVSRRQCLGRAAAWAFPGLLTWVVPWHPQPSCHVCLLPPTWRAARARPAPDLPFPPAPSLSARTWRATATCLRRWAPAWGGRRCTAPCWRSRSWARTAGAACRRCASSASSWGCRPTTTCSRPRWGRTQRCRRRQVGQGVGGQGVPRGAREDGGWGQRLSFT